MKNRLLGMGMGMGNLYLYGQSIHSDEGGHTGDSHAGTPYDPHRDVEFFFSRQ
jgi:hypothetical protein